MIDVNLFGVLFGLRHASRAMGPGDAIVNTASMAGIVGFPGLSIYGTSKWGVALTASVLGFFEYFILGFSEYAGCGER